jgi:hypothetical protein
MAFSTILKLIVLIEILNISAVYSKVESANEPDKEFKKPDKLIKEPIKEIKRLKCYTSGPPREESPINMEIMPNETNCFIRPPHPAHPKDTPFCVGFAGYIKYF